MADCTASTVAESTSDDFFFPVETPEGACLSSPSQDYRRPRGETSSSSDNKRSRENACPEMDGGLFEHLL